MVVSGLMVLFASVLLLAPVTHGEEPFWGALFLIVLTGFSASPSPAAAMCRRSGQQGVLSRTMSGELHGYAREELGVVTASSHPTVRSAGRFVVMAVFFAALAAFSLLLVVGPASQGQDRCRVP